MKKKRIWLYGAIVILLVAFVVLMLYRIVGIKPAASEEMKKRELIAKQTRVKLTSPPVIGVSEDNLHIAWAQVSENGKLMVVVDGKTDSLEYDEVRYIVISPKGERVAYPVRKGSKWYMVVDGQIGPAYDEINISCTTFSPDGKRFAYGARKGGRWFIVLDGKAIPEEGHSSVSYFAFSPDNRHFVYAAGKNNKQSVVLDGKAGPFYSLTGKPVWSPDSKHLAYVAWYSQDIQCVVLDGKEGKKYSGINIPIFSSDSKHIAYSVREGAKRFIVVDGKEGSKYEMSSTISQIKFAPDDDRLAYAVAEDEKWMIVIDGKESFPYDGIGGSGSRIALRSDVIGGSGSFIELISGVIGGSESGIALSPDGKSFAYVVYEKGKWFVVLNGEEQQKYDGITLGTPIFSPDGEHILYGARLEGKWFTVMDGEEGADMYDEIGQGVSFSSDGKHIVYSARKGNKWFVVLDGKAGKEYDRLSRAVFKDSKIEYLAERDRDGRLLRIRQPYPDGDIDAEAYKAIVEEVDLACLPEPKSK